MMPRITREEKGSVRMGPVTLISLVVILCLSVLCVLSFTTARASFAQTQRQAEFVSATYLNEGAGQDYVQLVADNLAKAQADGASREAAMDMIRAASPSVAQIDSSTIRIAFKTSQTDRLLHIQITVHEDLTYTVDQWKTSVKWSPDNDSKNSIWQGSKK